MHLCFFNGLDDSHKRISVFPENRENDEQVILFYLKNLILQTENCFVPRNDRQSSTKG